MVLPFIIIGVVAIASALLAGTAVYFDGQKRGVRYKFWALGTAAGFLFGLLPGVIILVIYLALTRVL